MTTHKACEHCGGCNWEGEYGGHHVHAHILWSGAHEVEIQRMSAWPLGADFMAPQIDDAALATLQESFAIDLASGRVS